jgi:hypothetical protein
MARALQPKLFQMRTFDVHGVDLTHAIAGLSTGMILSTPFFRQVLSRMTRGKVGPDIQRVPVPHRCFGRTNKSQI